jgi:hypothetical protein
LFMTICRSPNRWKKKPRTEISYIFYFFADCSLEKIKL